MRYNKKLLVPALATTFGLLAIPASRAMADNASETRFAPLTARAVLLCAFGAVAPSLVWLTVTQTLGRPVGITLLLLVHVDEDLEAARGVHPRSLARDRQGREGREC